MNCISPWDSKACIVFYLPYDVEPAQPMCLCLYVWDSGWSRRYNYGIVFLHKLQLKSIWKKKMEIDCKSQITTVLLCLILNRSIALHKQHFAISNGLLRWRQAYVVSPLCIFSAVSQAQISNANSRFNCRISKANL